MGRRAEGGVTTQQRNLIKPIIRGSFRCHVQEYSAASAQEYCNKSPQVAMQSIGDKTARGEHVRTRVSNDGARLTGHPMQRSSTRRQIVTVARNRRHKQRECDEMRANVCCTTTDNHNKQSGSGDDNGAKDDHWSKDLLVLVVCKTQQSWSRYNSTKFIVSHQTACDRMY